MWLWVGAPAPSTSEASFPTSINRAGRNLGARQIHKLEVGGKLPEREAPWGLPFLRTSLGQTGESHGFPATSLQPYSVCRYHLER